MGFFRRKDDKVQNVSAPDIVGVDLLRMGMGGTQEISSLLKAALELGLGAGDVLALAREQTLKGSPVKAYSLLQGYLELRPQEFRAPEMAQALALLSLRELHRPDLAMQWARYGIALAPEGEWVGKLTSILNSLA